MNDKPLPRKVEECFTMAVNDGQARGVGCDQLSSHSPVDHFLTATFNGALDVKPAEFTNSTR